jgi:23S rRNA (uracil1939-C5)-methyltransferase
MSERSPLSGKIIDTSSQGWGVLKCPRNGVVFIPETFLDDVVEFEIIKRGKFTLGRVLNFIQKSDAHREAPCPHAGHQETQCGGCPWMSIKYPYQLREKERKVRHILDHNKIVAKTIHPIEASPKEFEYRNRIKILLENNQMGFRAALSSKLAPIDQCLVAEKSLNQRLSEVKNSLKDKPMADQELWIQNKAQQSEFQQGNSLQNEKIISLLSQKLSELKPQSSCELFCGSGNFTHAIAQHSQNTLALESSKEAIHKLLSMGLPKLKAQAIDLYSQKALWTIDFTVFDFLFLDPPRTGFKDLSAVLEKSTKLESFIYLSCNPMTFARDVKGLSSRWKLEEFFLFDMFPQTAHVEVMGFFIKASNET